MKLIEILNVICGVCVGLSLLLDTLAISKLNERVDALQSWIEALHNISFADMTEAYEKWKSEGPEEPKVEGCVNCPKKDKCPDAFCDVSYLCGAIGQTSTDCGWK